MTMTKQTLSEKARDFAKFVHRNQVRKYTGEPYFKHLQEVVDILKDADIDDETALAVAYLHDTMEDQGITFDVLTVLFGEGVALGVEWLSDMEKGNRATRKALARERLARAPAVVQSIKVADLISNYPSIKEHDPAFFKVYREEVAALSVVLTKADVVLWSKLRLLIQKD